MIVKKLVLETYIKIEKIVANKENTIYYNYLQTAVIDFAFISILSKTNSFRMRCKTC